MVSIPVLLLIYYPYRIQKRLVLMLFNDLNEFILKMHETTKLNIEKMNEKYRIAVSKGRKEVKLEPGDLVWLHLRKERFLELRKSKLMSRAAGHFKIIAKINDNAYKLELPPEFGVSPRFNISDLRPYFGEEDEMPSRTTSMQEGEDNEGINTSATIIPSNEISGPITRSRAQQLNHQVNSFLCSSAYNIESRLLSNDLIVLRNQGEDHEGQTEHQKGVGEPRRHAREGGKPIQFGIAEFESNSESRTTLYSN
jgi:translation initiation factor IF-1